MQMMPMCAADLKAVAAIEQNAFRNPWGLLAFINELACEYAYCYVLKTNQFQVIAYTCFRLIFDELHVLKIAVREGWRKKGIAFQFFKQCLEAVPEPFSLAFLEVRPSNTAGIRLYEKLGFYVIGKRPGYYLDTGEDAIMMGKTFKGGSYERENSH